MPEAVLLMEEEVPHAASLGEADGYGFHEIRARKPTASAVGGIAPCP